MPSNDYGVLHIEKNLNPAIWDGDSLKEEVAKKLMQIAGLFTASIDAEIPTLDVVITGSSASYNWSESWSDIDLHVIYDIDTKTDIGSAEKALIDARKSIWNDTYDIRIKGLPVEVYGQEKGSDTVNNGLYSVINRKWIKRPSEILAIPSEEEVLNKANPLEAKIMNAIDSKNLAKLEAIAARIKRIRQSGLNKKGLYSVENLAFKVLRRSGVIENLYNAIADAKEAKLSLS